MKIISVWKPWNIGKVDEVVDHVVNLRGGEVCIKATDGTSMYGVNAWVRARWNGKDNRDLEKAAKDRGLGVSIWVVPYFRDWAIEVDLIKQAVDWYNPRAVYLDVERFRWTAVDEKGMIQNVGPFLRRLGRLPCEVLLQATRRPTIHPEISPEKWFAYKDLGSGKLIVDANGAQLYPIGWTGAANWELQNEMDVDSNEEIHDRAGRSFITWAPTLPAFSEYGWTPHPDDLAVQIDYLKRRLGTRLTGFNFWALDHLKDIPDLYNFIATVQDPAAPEPDPDPDVGAWVQQADDFLKAYRDLDSIDPGPAPDIT